MFNNNENKILTPYTIGALFVAIVMFLFTNALTVDAAESESYTYKCGGSTKVYYNGSLNMDYYSEWEITTDKRICGVFSSSDDGSVHIIEGSATNHYAYDLRCTVFNVTKGSFSYGVGALRNIMFYSGSYGGNSGFRYEHNWHYNFPIFSDFSDAYNYFATGNIEDCINEYQVDLDNSSQFDSSYSILGFRCNTDINATWSGASAPTLLPDAAEVVNEYVKVYALYDLGSVELATVPLTDSGYSVNYSSISTAEEPLRKLRFVPIYSHGTGFFGLYNYGNSVYVSFDESGNITDIEKPSVDISGDGVLDEAIPIPEIVMHDIKEGEIDVNTPAYTFSFNNASEKYNIELQGRWYSVDDITLYKENLMWKYKYDTLLKSALTTWVSYDDRLSSVGLYCLDDLGKANFETLLQTYPIENRTYLGGKNSVNDYLFGYNDALTMLKTMHLPYVGGLFNGCEIYVRYWYEDAEGIHYSKWTHWFDEMAKPSGSSGSQWDDKDNMFSNSQSSSGLTDTDKESLETSGNSKNDLDAEKEIHYDYESAEELAEAMGDAFGIMGDMVGKLGDVPKLFSSVFSFMPAWVVTLLGLSIVVCIILRIAGR